jgi:hypothetical protein
MTAQQVDDKQIGSDVSIFNGAAAHREKLIEGHDGANHPVGLPFLASVPADPFDAKPLRFRHRPIGFVVYSIGVDGTDDGGAERPRKGRLKNYDRTFVVERQEDSQAAFDTALLCSAWIRL